MKGLRALMERRGGRQLRELHGGLEVSEYVRGLQLRRGGGIILILALRGSTNYSIVQDDYMNLK
jgi:hypothetical protein